MNIDALYGNLEQMKEIVREIYVFTNQLNQIRAMEASNGLQVSSEEKRLLEESIISLSNQVKILNNSLPNIIENIGLYKKLNTTDYTIKNQTTNQLVQVSYDAQDKARKISLIISDGDKQDFLENISKSNLSINQLKKNFSVEKPMATFGKPSGYAKLSNLFFRNLSNNLIEKGYFDKLNLDLRKMNSPFVINTYVSMILFTCLWMFGISIFIFIVVLFFNVSLLFPFLSPLPENTNFLLRAISNCWIILALPVLTGIFMYIYPSGEARSLGYKIDQELPFVAIHMSAIATSGVELMVLFKIIIRSQEYKYTNREFVKLVNLINFQGKDLVSALRSVAKTSPSQKLKELLDGLATTMTSGGNQDQFLTKHSETLLFDYRLEREKYTKTSETFMDIYISIGIAAPMIFLMLFVIIGSTGLLNTFVGLGINQLSILMILGIVLLNTGFIVFLKLKQPVI